jgi:hypothetical protein
MIYPYKVHDNDNGVEICEHGYLQPSVHNTVHSFQTKANVTAISFVFADIICIVFKIMASIYVHILMLL